MASFIEDLFSKLFPKKSLPFSHKENFNQSTADSEELENWLKGDEAKDLLGMISKNYHFKKSGIQAHPDPGGSNDVECGLAAVYAYSELVPHSWHSND